MLIPIESINQFNPEILYAIQCVTVKNEKYPTDYHHHDFLEISIIRNGTVQYMVEGKQYTMHKNDVGLFSPGIKHQTLVTEETVCSELHIGMTGLTSDTQGLNFIEHYKKVPIVSVKKYKEAFEACCEEIEKEKRLGSFGHSFMLKALAMKLILILYRELDENSMPVSLEELPVEARDKKALVQSVVDHMRNHYMGDISLDNMAKRMYVSSAYISKIFKEEIGTSPINYLIQLRLEKAKTLMESHQIPINMVAKSVGYDDPYYFSKLFKKYYGTSPSAYMKAYRKVEKSEEKS